MTKILIVDDEESILAPLEEMLSGEGYRVRAFDNPLKALELLRTQEFDLAIFDIKMPEMNGYELLSSARTIRPGLPVIFLSSKQEEQDQIIGFTLGADDFVGKPFSKHLLLFRIKSVLKRHTPNIATTLKPIEVSELVIDRERHLVKWRDEEVSLTSSLQRDISRWDVSSVTDMNNMFWGAMLFNCDISKLDVSRVL